MEPLLRRWKLLAMRYKRESALIHEKITEHLVLLTKDDIRKLNLGNVYQFKFGRLMII